MSDPVEQPPPLQQSPDGAAEEGEDEGASASSSIEQERARPPSPGSLDLPPPLHNSDDEEQAIEALPAEGSSEQPAGESQSQSIQEHDQPVEEPKDQQQHPAEESQAPNRESDAQASRETCVEAGEQQPPKHSQDQAPSADEGKRVYAEERVLQSSEISSAEAPLFSKKRSSTDEIVVVPEWDPGYGPSSTTNGSSSKLPASHTKYRVQTGSPSDGDDVRWYFCKAPLGLHEPAASVPATEVIGKSDFFRFSLRDSHSLEAEFLKEEEELLSMWWKEYAECKGPSRSKRSSSNPAMNRASSEFYDEAVGVPVKGGLYEVDLISRRCFPVYWNGEHRRVLRGHWFAKGASRNWLPLREDIAEQLEFAYRSKIWEKRSFQPSGQFAARLDFQGATPGLHALFTGEEHTWEASLHVDASGISSMFGLTSTGLRLRRGFAPSDSLQPSQDELRQKKEEEMDDYCSQVPVRHLVFMVHGIGQRLEKANLVDDVSTFRRIVSALAEKHLSQYQRNTQRVLFIPCQWRRHLKLGGEAAVEQCTLEGVRALRTMVGATVHDVLYYMSPIYCQDIIDSVSSSLNRLYEKFIRRNPGYDGKVSVYGHSLGSVLSFDILSHQESLRSSFPIQEVQTNVAEEIPPRDAATSSADELPEASNETDVTVKETGVVDKSELEVLKEEIAFLRTKLRLLDETQSSAGPSKRHHMPSINYTKLKFQVDTFFAVGSPLGLFLSLRNVRIGLGLGFEYWEDEGIEEEMPCCRQMMNIFHPYDPVAYRVEPLISKDYVGKRPAFIPYHRGGKRIHIGMQELGESLSARSKSFVSSLASVRTSIANAFSSDGKKLEKREEGQEEQMSYGALVMERVTGSPDGRVDYMLQDATFEHQYISAISSHTNYWHDPDTALFIIRHLYRDIPEESPTKVRQEEAARRRLLSEYGGYIESDISLTFSSKEAIAAEMAAAEGVGEFHVNL